MCVIYTHFIWTRRVYHRQCVMVVDHMQHGEHMWLYQCKNPVLQLVNRFSGLPTRRSFAVLVYQPRATVGRWLRQVEVVTIHRSQLISESRRFTAAASFVPPSRRFVYAIGRWLDCPALCFLPCSTYSISWRKLERTISWRAFSGRNNLILLTVTLHGDITFWWLYGFVGNLKNSNILSSRPNNDLKGFALYEPNMSWTTCSPVIKRTLAHVQMAFPIYPRSVSYTHLTLPTIYSV